MDEEKKNLEGQEGAMGNGPKDPSNPSAAEVDGHNPEAGGSGNGNSGGKGGRRRNGQRGGQGGSKGTDNDGAYLGVRCTQKSGIVSTATAVDDSGHNATRIRGEERAVTEEVVGRSIVTEAEATNLKYGEGTSFIDAKKELAKQLSYPNSPLKHIESTGEMHQIDKIEELIGLVTLPTEFDSIVYPKNQMIDEKIIKTDDSSTAPVSGAFTGQYIEIKKKKISGVYYAKSTPDADFSSVTVSDDSIADTNASGHYRYREAALAEKLMTSFENSKDKGLAKNPIYKAPNTDAILQLQMDVIRHTTQTIERAYLCVCEAMASISQDRLVYGMDQNHQFDHVMSWFEPILDLRKDVDKVHSISEFCNHPKLQFIKENWDVWSKFDGAYCYPKTTIAFKPILQDLLRFTRVSRDHRAPSVRCVLGHCAPYLYDDISYVNGELRKGVGIGGNTERVFYAFEDSNPQSITVRDPLFDGINDMLADHKMKGHPWNTDTACAIPMTFDPKMPTFALLIMRSIPQIIDIMETDFSDLYQYLADGGKLPNSFVKYPFAKMDAFIKDAGYSSDSWHDVNKGVTYVIDANANLRLRHPETMMLVNENTDDTESLFNYYPGFVSPFTMVTEDDVQSFSGILNFPAGRNNIVSDRFAAVLDPIIFVDAAGFKTGASTVTVSKDVAGTAKPLVYKMAYVKAAKLSIAKFMTARRLTGLIYSIPTGVVPFNVNIVEMSNGSVGTLDAAKFVSFFKKTLNDVDVSDLDSRCTRSIQICSYRMEFALPIDEFKSAHVYICNDTHKIDDLRADVAKAFSRAKYNKDTIGVIGRYVKIASGVVSTKLSPAELVKFPFGWTESKSHELGTDADDALAACLERWSYHASFLQMYSNPFYGIRESKTSGTEDATVILRGIPHQKMINSMFYWYELDCSLALANHRTRMDADIDIVEPTIFSI